MKTMEQLSKPVAPLAIMEDCLGQCVELQLGSQTGLSCPEIEWPVRAGTSHPTKTVRCQMRAHFTDFLQCS